ncbi:unnamed protein product, partial [marine sediment metagenome]
MVSGLKKNRKQLLDEIAALRGRLEQLEDAEGKWKRTEEALRESERDKSLILGSLSELITYQDNSMKVVWANKAAGDSVGQSPEELVGRYCYEIWHGRKEPCRDCPVAKSIETGRQQQGEITTPDGRVWYMRGCPVLNEQGEVTGAVEVTLEVTERKRAERALRESEKRFRDIAENAFAWIWEVDVNGKYTYASPVVEEIFVREVAGFDGRLPVIRQIMPVAESEPPADVLARVKISSLIASTEVVRAAVSEYVCNHVAEIVLLSVIDIHTGPGTAFAEVI